MLRTSSSWRPAVPLFAGVALAASCGEGDPAPPASSIDGGGSDGGGVLEPSPQKDAGDAGDDADADAGPVHTAFGLDVRPSNASCLAPPRPVLPAASSAVTFVPVFTAISPPLDLPVMLHQLPGDSSHWFAALLGGKLVRFSSVNPQATPDVVADLSALSGFPIARINEGGFLGFAPHPRFAQNGRIYVSWNTLDPSPGNAAHSRVGYITSTDGGASFTSYTDVLTFDVGFTVHLGGGIAFGTTPKERSHLYLSFGDNGSALGQRTTTFLAKVLRIDVDNVPMGSTYGIPNDNPFTGLDGGGEPATYAIGFRNPFRFSIDRVTGQVWVGDVGERTWEEIDRVDRGGNYGWSCREGKHDYGGFCADKGVAIDPIIDHEHVAGTSPSRSVTGGVVYRGKAIPSLVSSYIYGDEVTAEIFALTFDPTTGAPMSTVINGGGGAPKGNWVHFAEDNDGEIYAVGLGGLIFKMVPAATTDGGASPPSTFPARLSETGCVVASDPKKPATGLVPFDVNAAFWSDGANKERWLAVPDNKTITVNGDGDFDLPSGSVLMKTLSLGTKRIETQLLMRHDDGVWAGYSYAWLDDESDAVLLHGSSLGHVGAALPAQQQEWYFPSRAECMQCHTDRAGRSLGLELGQLNGDFLYASTNRISNQLATLEHIGLFAAPLPGAPKDLPVIPPPLGTTPVEGRARAYLHSNCSMCHRPPGEGRALLDLRFATDLKATQTCNTDAGAGALGITNAKLLTPGDPALSLLSIRGHSTDAWRMPPRLASSVVDKDGLVVVDSWIKALTTCPP